MSDALPECTLEVINPDDIVVIGINDRWYRSFTSTSDRYPLTLVIPSEYLQQGTNIVTGEYTNVAVTGKNDAEIEYKVHLDGQEVVHVIYRTEVEAQTFTMTFRDSFTHDQRAIDRGRVASKGASRFEEMMSWGAEGSEPGPT